MTFSSGARVANTTGASRWAGLPAPPAFASPGECFTSSVIAPTTASVTTAPIHMCLRCCVIFSLEIGTLRWREVLTPAKGEDQTRGKARARYGKAAAERREVIPSIPCGASSRPLVAGSYPRLDIFLFKEATSPQSND